MNVIGIDYGEIHLFKLTIVNYIGMITVTYCQFKGGIVMMFFVVGSVSAAVLVVLGGHGYKKYKDFSTEQKTIKKERRYEDEVQRLYKKVANMNPFETENGTIFDYGQDLINNALYIRDSKNKDAWYLDNKFLPSLIDYHNQYKELLKKYNKDAYIEQFLFEGLVRGYQAFWINLEKQESNQERISYMKDMFEVFNAFRPKLESELEVLISDQELRENMVIHNQRIESKETMANIFESSISHLQDKKRFSIAKTIHDTNEKYQLDGTHPLDEHSKQEVKADDAAHNRITTLDDFDMNMSKKEDQQ